jgi:hypothetical protein
MSNTLIDTRQRLGWHAGQQQRQGKHAHATGASRQAVPLSCAVSHHHQLSHLAWAKRSMRAISSQMQKDRH